MTRDEADQALAAAISNHADAYDLRGDHDEMLDSYATIAVWTPTDDDGTTGYTLHFHNPSIPSHIALGLFAHAANQIAFQANEGEP